MKGLNKDFNVINQPAESYTFALNATATTNEAKFANLSNEPANQLSFFLPDNYVVWGTLFINDATIIFSGDSVSSQIGRFDGTTYTVIIDDTNESCKLNFTSIIKGKEYRVKSGCDNTIYWSDNFNPDRYLNLDDINSVYTNEQLDCNKFLFNRNISIPSVDLLVNNQGGILSSGSYAFVIEYLDDALNVIYKSIPTRFVPIYNDSLNSDYNEINGSLNIDQFASTQGGVPPTNKSIDLLITNIDPTATFVRVNVIESSTSSGEIKTAHTLGTLIPVIDSSSNFTYPGFNPDNGDTLIPYDSLVTRFVKYNRSRAMEQIDNRLIRANVSEVVRDYSNYQRVANTIVTTPNVRPQRARNINTLNNSKNPTSYINGKTFQGDEIYALGIVYIHEDGTESPVFHIPGRAKITGVDDTLINYDANNPDLKHLPVKTLYEQWEVYNTAAYNDSTRRMGYYETNTTYPTIKDCDGENIYGDLAGQPIRHHRFPCRKEVVLQYEGSPAFLNYLGIRFSNIQYPDSSITAHRFVYVKRTRFNKTILDAGYITGVGKPSVIDNVDNPNEFIFDGGAFWQNTNLFLPQDERYSKDVVQFISPKTLGNLYTGGTHLKFNYVTQSLITETFGASFQKEGPGEFQIVHKNYQQSSQFNIVPNYRSYNNNIFIGVNSVQNNFNGFVINNESLSNNGNVILLEDQLESLIVDDLQPTIDVRNIYAYNKQYLLPYSNLQALRYSVLTPVLYDTNDYLSFHGDTFINELNIASITGNTIIGDNTEVLGDTYQLNFVESDINFDLRVNGTDCNTVWNNDPTFVVVYLLSKVATGSSNSYVAREGDSVCPEFYYYNRDYDILSSYTTISLPGNYDYCDRCLYEKPNRIIFSPKSFSEEQSDFYLYNYVNDYIDIPQERGEIVGMKYKNGRLYVHTTDTTFVLQPNPQSISTNENTAYLTTGDFLSIPSQELMTTDLGFGGMQYELANINTEFGYFWVDQKRGQIYRLQEGLDTISNKGLTMWFKENIKNNVELAYDPYFQRLIISHKENYISNCDEAFSLSFFPFYDSFVSFYSYLPDMLFSTHNTFYTIKGNSIYEHLKKGKYLEFYGEVYPFVIEEVKNDFSTDNLDFIMYYTEFYKEQNDHLNRIKDSYHYLTVYNDNQSTGKLNLVLLDQVNNPYQNIQLTPNQKSVIITDRNSKISNLYDLSINNIVTEKPCRRPEYTDVNFINTDIFKDQYEYALFRDKYLKARLYYYPVDTDVKLIHYLTDPVEQQSIR